MASYEMRVFVFPARMRHIVFLLYALGKFDQRFSSSMKYERAFFALSLFVGNIIINYMLKTNRYYSTHISYYFSDTIRWQSSRDTTGAYMIDRSSTYFEPILDYLRHGTLIVVDDRHLVGILEEAKFYGLSSLVALIDDRIANKYREFDDIPLTRAQMIDALLACPFTIGQQLRLQGLLKVVFSFQMCRC